MGKQIAVYLILSLIFIGGSIYNFTIRKQCTYPIRLIRSRATTIFPNQYYSSEDIEEINKYIKMKIKND